MVFERHNNAFLKVYCILATFFMNNSFLPNGKNIELNSNYQSSYDKQSFITMIYVVMQTRIVRIINYRGYI